MHSKLFSRILVIACVIVMGGLAVLGGMTMRFSDNAWNQMIESIAGLNRRISADVSLMVDVYDSVTEDVTIQLTGSASSVNGEVTLTCYRCDDVGRVIEPDEIGELGALQSQYAVALEGGMFTTPDLHLKDGENHFLFVAEDSLGLAAVEVVHIEYRMGKVHGIDQEHVAVSDTGISYQNNIIVLTFNRETLPERAREIIAEIGGTEVGNIAILRRYQVRVPAAEYNDLNSLCEEYKNRYEEIVMASPEIITNFGAEAETGEGSGESAEYIPNDPWNDGHSTEQWDENYPSGNNWNLECIQAQSAWQFKPYFRQFTVGIIDCGFLDGHDDLRLYFGDDRRVVDDHGTHIAGIIGAVHDNGTGLSGVMNKGRVFAYPLNAAIGDDGLSFTLNSSELIYSLVNCVINGSSVINVSLGNAGSSASADEINMDSMILSDAMGSLLAEGYDFVVVQSAGNGDEANNAIDADRNGWFCSVFSLEDPSQAEYVSYLSQTYGVQLQDLTDRIIVVANAVNRTETTPYFELANSSNCGEIVEIAAPGTQIYSTLTGGTLGMGSYGMMSGTSMAAPHVAAVAAMAWSTNPDITGADVKEILLENTCYTAVSAPDSPMPGYEYPIVNAFLAVKAAIEFERIDTFANIKIKDAENNNPLEGATIVVTAGVEAGGPTVGQYTTDNTGLVRIALDSGDYVLNISKEGYISNQGAAMHLEPEMENHSEYSLSRELGENETRIVLSWGATPRDLDSHLLIPVPNSNAYDRVFYSDKICMRDGVLIARLDVDDTSSFGPETTTIYDLPQEPMLYCVHDFSNQRMSTSMEMSNSNMTVQVLRHDDVLATYTVSPNRNSREWILFWLMPDGSIVDVNEYTSTCPIDAGSVGDSVFREGVR